MSTLYLLLGVQGSGKSTWAAANAERLQAVVLASDEVRNELVQQGQGARAENGDAVFAIFNRRLVGLLHAGRNVISDATHARRAWRKEELMIAHGLNTHVVGVWFDVSVAVCVQRNAGRTGNTWGEQVVPESYLKEVAAGFEVPQPGEFDEVWKLGD